jgi:hypothetical protein
MPTSPMPWIVDAYVLCPACEQWDDASAMFGHRPSTDDLPTTHPDATMSGIRDGLKGTCTMCGATVMVLLRDVT